MSLNDKRVFALVPARAGSKGIPQKNIYPINGKPLIDFTIDAAALSPDIDKIFVSSDSHKILEHVASKKVHTILRPKDIAKDNSSAVDVVNHFYEYLAKNNYIKQEEDFYLIYLQPTSPLRDTQIINKSFRLMRKSKSDSLISLVKNQFTPYKSFLIDKKGLAESLFEESMTNENRQILRDTYRANGAIYTFLFSKFVLNEGFPSNKSIGFIMNDEESLDIDSYDDVDRLKSILSKKN